MRARTVAHGGGLGAGGFLVLASLSALSPLTSVFILPALPELAVDLTTSLAAAQWALSVGFAGLAVGLLVVGPLSDRFGRRAPLMVGLVCYIATTVLCAIAPDIQALVLFRLMQGIAGGAVWVVTRAVVRDAYAGQATARVYSQMAMITGLAPVIAPFLAGQLLLLMDWRGLFVVLAVVGAVVMIIALFFMRESLAPERRHSGGIRAQMVATGVLARSSHFLLFVTIAIVQSSMYFTFVIMSPFVFHADFDLDAQEFGIFFAVAALMMTLGNQANVLILRRWRAERVLQGLLLVALAGSLTFLTAVLADAPVVVVMVCILLVPFAAGASNANITALTMAPFPHVAGATAAVLGAAQFGVAALVPPLISLWGVSGLTMAITLVVTAAIAASLAMTSRVRGSGILRADVPPIRVIE